MQRTWIEDARSIGISRGASLLGVTIRTGNRFDCPNPACDSHKPGKRASAVMANNGDAWACYQKGCYIKGDVVDLASWVMFGEQLKQNDERWQEIRALLGDTQAIASAVARTPQATESRVFMSPETVSAILSASVPGSSVKHVSAWARSRGIDPGLPELRVLTSKDGLPVAVAELVAKGYDVVIPLADHMGVMRGVRMRTTDDKRELRTMCPAGYTNSGLVMASLTAISLLEHGTDRLGMLGGVVAEGDPDFLVACSYWGARYAVVGTGSGMWSAVVGARLSAIRKWAIYTHNDDDGGRYAEKISISMPGLTERILAEAWYEYAKRPRVVGAKIDLCNAANDGLLGQSPFLDGPQDEDTPADLPFGYYERDGRLYMEQTRRGEAEPVRVCNHVPRVAMVAMRDDGTQWATVVWKDGTKNMSAIVPASILRSSGAIVTALGGRGLGIHSGNAGIMTAYFDTMLTMAKRRDAISSMGWHQDACMLGLNWITRDEEASAPVATYAEDPGSAAVARAYTASAGSLKDWLDIVRPIGRHPVVGMAALHILGSIVAGRIGSRRATMALVFKPGSGKTPAVSIGMSCIANPKEDGGAMFSWDMSQARLHATCALLRNLPLWLDDKQTGRSTGSSYDRRVSVVDAVYQIANGLPGARMHGGAQSYSPPWALNAITTSENAVLPENANEGAVKRLIQIYANPWMLDTGMTADEGSYFPRTLVETTMPRLESCYGHAGIALARALLVADVEDLKKEYQQARDRITSILSPHPFAPDYANIIAVWRVTHGMMQVACRRAGGWPWSWDTIETVLVRLLREQIVGAKPTTASFWGFLDWAMARRTSTGPFIIDAHNQRIPDVVFGVWPHGPHGPGSLTFNRDAVERFIADRRPGFSVPDLLSSWVDAGFLERNTKTNPRSKLERYAQSCRWGSGTTGGIVHGFRVAMHMFRPETREAAENGEQTATPTSVPEPAED